VREIALVGPLERALHLRSLSMFEGLRPREVGILAQLMKEEFQPAGAVLCLDGAPPTKLRLLVEGSVRNEKAGRALGTQRAPGLIGLSGVLGGRPASVRSVAETPLTLLSIDAQDFLDVIEDRFDVFLELRRYYAAHVARLQRWLGVFRTVEPVDTSSFPSPDRPLGIVERLLCLQRTHAFHGIPLNVLAQLVRDEHEARASAGDTLWRDGDPGNALLLIVHGRVRCGDDSTPGSFVAGPGYILGADAAFGGIPYAYDALCETPVVAISIHATALTDLIEDHFELGRRALGHFAEEDVRLQVRKAALDAADGSTLAPSRA
jgi:CRP-like cAMP-binding protein